MPAESYSAPFGKLTLFEDDDQFWSEMVGGGGFAFGKF